MQRTGIDVPRQVADAVPKAKVPMQGALLL